MKHSSEPFNAAALYGDLFAGWTREQCEEHARAHFAVCVREMAGPVALVDRPGHGRMTVRYIRLTDDVIESVNGQGWKD